MKPNIMIPLHLISHSWLYIVLSALICTVKSIDVATEKQESRNSTCGNFHKGCTNYTEGRIYDLTDGFPCHCDPFCSQLGTCCLDSPFRKRDVMREVLPCRPVNNEFFKGYFMIDKCPPNIKANDAFQAQCEEEQNIVGDLMSLVPVTSLSTNLTYKNYFCFRCHEETYEYLFWNVKLLSGKDFNISRDEEVIPVHSKTTGEWLVSVDGTVYPVSIEIEIPKEMIFLPKRCYQNLISSCSEKWPQDATWISQKCGLYMFIITVSEDSNPFSPISMYRNPHCAICNFETFKKRTCIKPSLIFPAHAPKPFSFTHLLDINRSNGEMVGKVQRCDDDSRFDPFFKKCRKLVCAMPGYAVKDGKCRAP